MKTKREIIEALTQMKALVLTQQLEHPDDLRFPPLAKELDRVESRITSGWPLPKAFASDLRFGLFAVRELDDFPELSDQLCDLDRLLKASAV